MKRGGRIDGVGSIQMDIELKHDAIQDLHLTGDFLPLCDAREMLLERLRGKLLTPPALHEALEGCDAGKWIMNLTNEQLISLLTN